jgi:hypothetical protein
MKLDKTLNNLRKTNKGFFNITDGFLNLDLYKEGLSCNYKIGFEEFGNHILKKNDVFIESTIGCVKFESSFGCFYIFKNIINDEYKRFYRDYNLQLYIGDLKKIYEIR